MSYRERWVDAIVSETNKALKEKLMDEYNRMIESTPLTREQVREAIKKCAAKNANDIEYVGTLDVDDLLKELRI